MRYVKDSKEHEAQHRRIEEEKQASYNKMLRVGASAKAKERFRRPAYYGTEWVKISQKVLNKKEG